jgi:hypothetical protein
MRVDHAPLHTRGVIPRVSEESRPKSRVGLGAETLQSVQHDTSVMVPS